MFLAGKWWPCLDWAAGGKAVAAAPWRDPEREAAPLQHAGGGEWKVPLKGGYVCGGEGQQAQAGEACAGL